MKPNKSLEELLGVVRSLQERAYHLRKSNDTEKIQQLMVELASLNFSLSYYRVHYESLYNGCETEYKVQAAKSFMESKADKKSDSASDKLARIANRDLRDEYNGYYESFQTARALHDDVETLIGVLRSRSSSLKNI